MDEIVDFMSIDDCSNTQLTHYSLPSARFFESA